MKNIAELFLQPSWRCADQATIKYNYIMVVQRLLRRFADHKGGHKSPFTTCEEICRPVSKIWIVLKI